MEAELTYKMTDKDLKKALSEFVGEELEEKVYNKFLNIMIDSRGACQILGISERSLHNYINVNLLEPEEKVYKGKIKFRLSYLLKIDISEIKRKMRHSLY